MAFTIPNELATPTAQSTAQASPSRTDIDIIAARFDDTGVSSGCAVTAQATPNNTVAVATGVAEVLGVEVVVIAGNVTMTAAHATLPRYDLITVSNTGVLTWNAGTASAAPTILAALPANHAALAAVYVPAADATIVDGQIVDKRADLISQEGFGAPPWITGNYYGTFAAPLFVNTTASNPALVALRHYAVPVYVPRSVNIDQIAMWVVTGVAASVLRMGIYTMGADGKPGTLVAESAQVASATTGAAALHTFTGTLPRLQGGRWHFLTFVSGHAPVISGFAASSFPLGAATIAAVPNRQAYAYNAVGAIANALPASFGAITAYLTGNVPYVYLRAAA